MANTIAEKLLIKPNSTIWLSHPAYLPRLTPMPAGVRQVDTMATAGVAVIFVDDAARARTILTEHKAEITKPGVVWLAYPKGGKADINHDSLRPIVAEFGLRPDGQVDVDNLWSALRFRADREGESAFTGGTQ
jgi:hypothetical protein